MWLDELKSLRDTLAQRIQQHRVLLQKNETLTRYVLIDPLLTKLGWDLSDPNQVVVEYSTKEGRADYAMVRKEEAPVLIVEAKSLDRPVSQGVHQSISYCISEGIEYFVVTNGDVWEVYETHKPVPLDQKQLLSFQVSNIQQNVVMRMLWLWRGNFSRNFQPEVPIISDLSLIGENGSETKPLPKINEPKQDAGKSSKRIPLSTFNAGEGLPIGIEFPDGSIKDIKKWWEFQARIVEWLADTRKLTVQQCPIKTNHGAFLINTKPRNSSGKIMRKPYKFSEFFVNKYGSALGLVRRIIRILEICDVDPSTISVIPSTNS